MAAKHFPQTADKGATYTLSIRYMTGFGDNGVDLSGHTARFVLTTRSQAGDLIDEQVATTTADGWIHVVVSDEDTALWPDGTHAYRLELDNAGALTFVVFGPFKVRNMSDV